MIKKGDIVAVQYNDKTPDLVAEVVYPPSFDGDTWILKDIQSGTVYYQNPGSRSMNRIILFAHYKLVQDYE